MIHNAVIYYAPVQKPLNGTLFYSYEYYSYILSLESNIKFYVIYEDRNNIKLIEDCLRNKYKIFNEVIFLKKMELLRLKLNKVIILDKFGFENTIFSYKHLFVFLEQSSELTKKNCIKYGYYDYQIPFDKRDELCLYFDIQKKYLIFKDKIFVSSGKPNNVTLNNDELLLKKTDTFIPDLFMSFSKMLYVHNSIDTNNRIIPECFYHNKEIIFEDYNKSIEFNDSVIDRYNKCIQNTYMYFDITNSLLLKDYIEE